MPTKRNNNARPECDETDARRCCHRKAAAQAGPRRKGRALRSAAAVNNAALPLLHRRALPGTDRAAILAIAGVSAGAATRGSSQLAASLVVNRAVAAGAAVAEPLRVRRALPVADRAIGA